LKLKTVASLSVGWSTQNVFQIRVPAKSSAATSAYRNWSGHLAWKSFPQQIVAMAFELLSL